MNPEFMREAIRMSREMMQANKGGPFGAVIVREGEVIARGWNEVISSNDPTAHAEIVAIRRAGGRVGSFRLEGCRMYASCEPCPMCLAAIYWARLEKVYFANTRQDAAAIGFDDDFIYGQLALPLSKRRLPLEQCLRGEAIEVFEEWQRKPDRVMY